MPHAASRSTSPREEMPLSLTITRSRGTRAARVSAVCTELGSPPPVFIMEGGYNLDALAASVAATILGAFEEPPDREYLGVSGPVERSREALAPFWGAVR